MTATEKETRYVAIMVVAAFCFMGSTVGLMTASGFGSSNNTRSPINVFGLSVSILFLVGSVVLTAVAEYSYLPRITEERVELISTSRAASRAQRIVATQPRLAEELGIGRPDLQRGFADGGLLDVNYLPESALVEHLGLSERGTREFVEVRAEVGGFSSLDELELLVPETATLSGERKQLLIFRAQSL